jgi:hypothetical protein
MNFGRRFPLLRHVDETGISGEGIVAHGVVFPDGVACLRWVSEWPTSVVFYDRGMEAIEYVHGHSGSTEIVWLDLEEEEEDGQRHRHVVPSGDSVVHDSSSHQALLTDEHRYTSTACSHGLHDRCRKRCKFCGALCLCTHHQEVNT